MKINVKQRNMELVSIAFDLMLFLALVRIKSLDLLRGKKIFIRKVEDGTYLGFGYKSLISDPIRSGKMRKIL